MGAAFPNIVKGGSKRFADYLQDTKQINGRVPVCIRLVRDNRYNVCVKRYKFLIETINSLMEIMCVEESIVDDVIFIVEEMLHRFSLGYCMKMLRFEESHNCSITIVQFECKKILQVFFFSLFFFFYNISL